MTETAGRDSAALWGIPWIPAVEAHSRGKVAGDSQTWQQWNLLVIGVEKRLPRQPLPAGAAEEEELLSNRGEA
jgi:hypothetical protein